MRGFAWRSALRGFAWRSALRGFALRGALGAGSLCEGSLLRGFALSRVRVSVWRRWDPVKRASEARVQVSNADVFDPSLNL